MTKNTTFPIVFILDDDPNLLAVVEAALDAQEFSVEAFTQPDALLDRLAVRQPDVILIDIRMPGMSGHQVFREIRARNTSVPVIVISASEKQEDAIEALRLRAFDFLRKPLKDFVLVNAVRQALTPEAPATSVIPDALPVASAPAATTVESSPDSFNVLLADDAESGRMLVKAYLQKTPYRLSLAVNGEDALAQFEAGAFHAVLMDMRMPDMHGLTATRRLRETEIRLGRERTPVIALTAEVSLEEIKASLEAGCDAHLTKPISRETLLACLEKQTKSGPAPGMESGVISERLRKRYIKSLGEMLISLQSALDEGDLGAASLIGHNIKGSGATYGFEELSRIGAEIERAAQEGESAAVQAAAGNVSQFLDDPPPPPAVRRKAGKARKAVEDAASVRDAS